MHSLNGLKEEGGVNQDAFNGRICDAGIIVAAVADGVGSLPDSHEFSQAAVAAVVESATELSEILSGDATPEHAPAAPTIETGHSIGPTDSLSVEIHAVIRRNLATRLDQICDKSGATTLLYAVITRDTVMWGRVGDGAVVLSCYEKEKLVIREMANKIYTSTDVLEYPDVDGSAWSIGQRELSTVEYMMLATDGITDATENKEEFFRYVHGRLAGLDQAEAEATLASILAGFPEAHIDDKTLAYIDLATHTDPESPNSDPSESVQE